MPVGESAHDSSGCGARRLEDFHKDDVDTERRSRVVDEENLRSTIMSTMPRIERECHIADAQRKQGCSQHAEARPCATSESSCSAGTATRGAALDFPSIVCERRSLGRRGQWLHVFRRAKLMWVGTIKLAYYIRSGAA